MTPAGRWAFEHAYGYGYQVFHPTPEERKQMIEEAKARRPEYSLYLRTLYFDK